MVITEILYKRMIYMCMFIGELVLFNVQNG